MNPPTPVTPPVAPMLAAPRKTLPDSPGTFFEPKWDGFRCVVFRAGDALELQSRNNKPLTRYFPELVTALADHLPGDCVVDGEIVIPTDRGIDFDLLSQRIHPAESRIERLAAETPAAFVAFDLLSHGSNDLRTVPFADRRRLLERAIGSRRPPVLVTPTTRDRAVAQGWFERFEGAGFDGVIAKAPDGPYLEGQRSMVKVKHLRTAEAVVAGFRMHKDGEGVGSLLLGLFDDSGRLHHIGVATGLSAAARHDMLATLGPEALPDGADHPWAEWRSEHESSDVRLPGPQNRWTGSRDQSWTALSPDRVAEVSFQGLTAGRLRHPARFVRWRVDRDPTDCDYHQVEVAPPAELSELFGVSAS